MYAYAATSLTIPARAKQRVKGWYVPSVAGTREFPHVCVDVKYWKSFVHERLAVAPGDPGAMTLFGKSAGDNALLAEHVPGSQTWTATHGHGRDVREWKVKPTRPDNPCPPTCPP